MKSKFKENLKKIILFSVFSTIGIFIFISLLSSSPEKNNFFMFDSLSDDSENFFGLVSSILSNFLFDIFGIVSYLFCVFLIFNGVRIVLGRETAWYSWLMLPITIILLCFILGSFNTQLALPFLSSGILGEGLIIYYDHYIGSTEYSNITYIFLILLLFFSIFLTFNIGYFEI